jgi:hypothetical protein
MTQKLLELNTGTSLKNKQKWLRKNVEEKINTGTYVEKLPSLREMSREYNANVITLQKSLKPLIEEGLLIVKRGSGIYITGKKHICIGIVGTPVDEYFFDKNSYGGAVFKHIFRYILNKGDYFAFHRKTTQISYSSLFRNNSAIDGLIVLAPGSNEKRELTSIHLPYIVIGSTFKGSNINYVDSDNEESAEKAVELLITNNYKKIAFIHGGSEENVTVALRLQGYKNALKKHGIAYDPNLVLNLADKEIDTGEMAQLLFDVSLLQPDAIFGASFPATRKLLVKLPTAALKNIGLVVYDDDNREMQSLGIPYWIVSQPLGDIGKTAITSLYKLLEGGTTEKTQVCLESRLTEINLKKEEKENG